MRVRGYVDCELVHAGIIVRNSILLVDFIQLQERAGVSLSEAVIKAGTIRTRPILLIAAALMVGAFYHHFSSDLLRIGRLVTLRGRRIDAADSRCDSGGLLPHDGTTGWTEPC